jgi:hypothetical protein
MNGQVEMLSQGETRRHRLSKVPRGIHILEAITLTAAGGRARSIECILVRSTETMAVSRTSIDPVIPEAVDARAKEEPSRAEQF